MIARAVAPTVAAAILITVARAPAAETPLAPAPLPAFDETPFGPRYVIEDVRVAGNRKTERSLIAGELAALGLAPGRAVDASDRRVETARYRLLSLGFFLDVHLSVARGSRRGAVVLIVDVEERGTLVINEIFAATSPATLFWGGTDVAEANFLGRGINLGAGFVASTQPLVANAHAGLGLRLHVAVPPLGGPNGVGLSVTGLYNDGSEFYRASGDDDDSDPGRFVATRVRRIGGVLTAGLLLPANFHASISFRQEHDSAQLPPLAFRTLPDGGKVPIDFMIQQGASRVGSATGSLQFDNRSDPVLPRSGARANLSVEVASALLGSSTTFVKGTVEASIYFKMPRGHALGLHLFGGAISGPAPYFDRFFIGDLDLLLPRRALGINFSTQAPPNFLGTSIERHRYDDYAGRVLVEYAVPIWRRRGLVYGGDAFVAMGLLGMASHGDLTGAGSGAAGLPVDLTGDLGLRLDTYVGVFTISIANALSRSSF
ncbi:MAG TPA: BamA/TamA family outer membrane protein [Polyangia bacterium]|nr:BamA/TamA family outer membrane protein [Polyangia bacterium]